MAWGSGTSRLTTPIRNPLAELLHVANRSRTSRWLRWGRQSPPLAELQDAAIGEIAPELLWLTLIKKNFHLVRLGSCTHTPTWRATVDESWSAVYLGYTHGSSLSVDGAQTTNLMVTQDTDKLFIQVRPPSWRNTYVLRLIVLICVERIWCMICPLGDPCPSLYILKGQSYKQSIIFGTLSCSLAVHAD